VNQTPVLSFDEIQKKKPVMEAAEQREERETTGNPFMD